MKEESAVSPVIGVMLMMVVTIVIAAVVSGLAGELGDIGEKTGPAVTLSDPAWDITATAPTKTGTEYTVEADHYRAKYNLDTGELKGDVTNDTGKSYKNFDIITLTDPGEFYGFIFTSLGGDAFDLKDLQISISSNNLASMADYDSIHSILSTTPDYEPGDFSLGDYIDKSRNTSNYHYEEHYTITGFKDESGNYYTQDEFDTILDNAFKSDEYRGYFHKIDPESPDDTIIRPGDNFKVDLDSCWINAGMDHAANAEYDIGFSSINNHGISEGVGIERGDGNEWLLSHKPSGAILASGPIEFTQT
jgi:FlaG/FlaF family flagellin (archaellin)